MTQYIYILKLKLNMGIENMFSGKGELGLAVDGVRKSQTIYYIGVLHS